MLPFVAAIVASYLLGSIPSAYLAGKSRGIDLRKHGSGNLGATNVMRVLGTKIGLLVFAVDMAKGVIPVKFFPRYVPLEVTPLHDPIVMAIICGVAAIIGHVRPIYLKFGKGGKGVATAAGMFLALAPVQTLTALVIFAVVLLSSGFVSLGSILSGVMLPVLLGISVAVRAPESRVSALVRSPVFLISVLVALFVLWTHRANITRLRNGEEHRFGKRGVAGKRTAATLAITLAIALATFMAARFS